jgi:hypothetical protein
MEPAGPEVTCRARYVHAATRNTAIWVMAPMSRERLRRRVCPTHSQRRGHREAVREVVERAQQRSAVYDMVTNGVPVAVEVATD